MVGQLKAAVPADGLFFSEGEEKRRVASGEVAVGLLDRVDDASLQLVAELGRIAEVVRRRGARSVVRVRGIDQHVLRIDPRTFLNLRQGRVDLGLGNPEDVALDDGNLRPRLGFSITTAMARSSPSCSFV